MFYHNKPGWGIALRIFLLLLLIGGAIAVTRAAYIKGYHTGLGTEGIKSVKFYGDSDKKPFQADSTKKDFQKDSDKMEFYGQQGYKTYYGQKGYMPQHYYPGSMYYLSRGGFFGIGTLHVILGILGLIVLVKLIMGFSGRRMYRHRMMHGDPEGKRYHRYPPYFHFPYYCPYCSGEHPEEESPEADEDKKSKKK